MPLSPDYCYRSVQEAWPPHFKRFAKTPRTIRTDAPPQLTEEQAAEVQRLFHGAPFSPIIGYREHHNHCKLSVLALPQSFRAAGVTDEQLVYGRFAFLARVFAPAAPRRFLDAFTA